MPWAMSDDSQHIFYEVHGQGPTLVFVPGYMGISDIWHEQVERLSAAFRCVVLDARGYGRSDKPLDLNMYSVEQSAKDVAVVMDAAGIDQPAVLVGHSMGGNIISSFYLQYPERVAGLVYIGTHLSGAQLVSLGLDVETLMSAVTKPADRVAFYTSFGLSPSIAMEAAKWPVHSMLGNAQALINSTVGERYSDVRAPALIIHGEKDVPAPMAVCTPTLLEALPSVTLEVLANVNHFPAVEAPGPVSLLIGNFARANTCAK